MSATKFLYVKIFSSNIVVQPFPYTIGPYSIDIGGIPNIYPQSDPLSTKGVGSLGDISAHSFFKMLIILQEVDHALSNQV